MIVQTLITEMFYDNDIKFIMHYHSVTLQFLSVLWLLLLLVLLLLCLAITSNKS